MSTQIVAQPTDGQFTLAAVTLKLVADPTRLRIVWALLHDEHSVNELADHVKAQPAAVSQHLAKLRLARLVKTRRQGNHVFYQAEDEHVRRVVEEALFHAVDVASGLSDHSKMVTPTATNRERRA